MLRASPPGFAVRGTVLGHHCEMPLLIWTLMITCTLVSGADSRILEVAPNRGIVWELPMGDHLYGWPMDVKGLPNGNLLVTTTYRVTEYDQTGAIIWEKTGLYSASDAQRLPNGNTLITETGFFRVIEIDPSGNIVWQVSGLNEPQSAQRLPNGNTLIVENRLHGEPLELDRVTEIDPSGNTVWQVSGLSHPQDADRLPNGNTLVVENELPREVSEFDPNGDMVWQCWPRVTNHACDAERMPNGNTVVGDSRAMVIELNATGHYLRTIWEGYLGHDNVEAIDVLANGNILIAVAVPEPFLPPSLCLLVACLLVAGRRHAQA